MKWFNDFEISATDNLSLEIWVEFHSNAELSVKEPTKQMSDTYRNILKLEYSRSF